MYHPKSCRSIEVVELSDFTCWGYPQLERKKVDSSEWKWIIQVVVFVFFFPLPKSYLLRPRTISMDWIFMVRWWLLWPRLWVETMVNRPKIAHILVVVIGSNWQREAWRHGHHSSGSFKALSIPNFLLPTAKWEKHYSPPRPTATFKDKGTEVQRS